MTNRLNQIFSVLPSCEVFADIGCDHGYVAKAMLDSGKCKKVIVSDISEKCLFKATTLLQFYTFSFSHTNLSTAFIKPSFSTLSVT